MQFDLLFDAYKKEHAFLIKNNAGQAWDDIILTAKDYHSYSKMHLHALAQWRFIPKEWPQHFREQILNMSLLEITALFNNDSQLSKAQRQGLQAKTVLDFITDFYLVRNAGSLAFADINQATQQTYQTMANTLINNTRCTASSDNKGKNLCQLKSALTQAFSIYDKLNHALPDRCLIIDMSENKSLQNCAADTASL